MKVVTQSPLTPVKLQTAKPKSRVSIWLKRIALGLAVGIGGLAVIGAAYQAIATAIDQRAFPPPGQLIDVGGFQMHLHCAGANVDGSPTVILENGLVRHLQPGRWCSLKLAKGRAYARMTVRARAGATPVRNLVTRSISPGNCIPCFKTQISGNPIS